MSNDGNSAPALTPSRPDPRPRTAERILDLIALLLLSSLAGALYVLAGAEALAAAASTGVGLFTAWRKPSDRSRRPR